MYYCRLRLLNPSSPALQTVSCFPRRPSLAPAVPCCRCSHSMHPSNNLSASSGRSPAWRRILSQQPAPPSSITLGSFTLRAPPLHASLLSEARHSASYHLGMLAVAADGARMEVAEHMHLLVVYLQAVWQQAFAVLATLRAEPSSPAIEQGTAVSTQWNTGAAEATATSNSNVAGSAAADMDGMAGSAPGPISGLGASTQSNLRPPVLGGQGAWQHARQQLCVSAQAVQAFPPVSMVRERTRHA